MNETHPPHGHAKARFKALFASASLGLVLGAAAMLFYERPHTLGAPIVPDAPGEAAAPDVTLKARSMQQEEETKEETTVSPPDLRNGEQGRLEAGGESRPEPLALAAAEASHWGGCLGSSGHAFRTEFQAAHAHYAQLAAVGQGDPDAKAGLDDPREVRARARLELLREISQAKTLGQSESSPGMAGREGMAGMAGAADSDDAEDDKVSEAWLEVARCRMLGRAAGATAALLPRVVSGQSACGDAMKEWGALIAEIDCRLTDLLPSPAPLPFLRDHALGECVARDAEECLASYDLTATRLGERCTLRAQGTAMTAAQSVRARSCFFR